MDPDLLILLKKWKLMRPTTTTSVFCLRQFPPVNDMVRWAGGFYSFQALEDLRTAFWNEGSRISRRINPVTRELLSEQEFLYGDVFLADEEKQQAQHVITQYQIQTTRREARAHFDQLLSRQNSLQALTQSQQRTRGQIQWNNGSTVASPPSEFVQRQLAQEDYNVAVLGLQNLQQVAAAAPPVPRAGRLEDFTDDESILAPVALATNHNDRNGCGAYGRNNAQASTTNRNPNPNRNDDPLAPLDNEPNPLQEDRQERIPLPTQFWGEPVIEEAYANCLALWESQGWPIYRSKTRYIEQHRLSLFGPNGPLSG